MSRTVIPGDRLCYLATPYTKYHRGPAGAYMDAAELAGRLLKTGAFQVFSPIAHSHPIAMHARLDPLDGQMWLRFNQPMLERCDVLLVAHLQGWDESQGIAHEIAYFEKVWRPIYDLNPVTLMLSRREIGPKEFAESALA